MLERPSKIKKDLSANFELAGSRQTPTSVAEVSLYTTRARSVNPAEGAFCHLSGKFSSAKFVEGGGESMPCPPCPEIQRNFQVAHESFNLEEIERRDLKILHAFSSGNALKRNHDGMTRLNSVEEEDFSSGRSRCNRPKVGKGGFIHEKDENAVAVDQSDSTVKVSSGDSDLTAERMAEASSRTTSCSDNNGCTLNRPPSSTTDASGIAIHQLPFTGTENIQVTSSDSGFQKSNIEDGQTVHRSEGFSPSSSKLVTEKDQDWLALGLGCGHGSRQPKHFSNSPHLEKPKNRKALTISGNEDQNKDNLVLQRPQMLNTGHTSKSTTVFPQSSTVPGQLLSLQNTSNSFAQPLQEANDFSMFNLLQPCNIIDQQRSLNISEIPSVEQMKFNFERQQNGATPRPSKGATHWQGFYDRISEVGNPSGAIVGASNLRIAGTQQGKQRFFPGWRSFVSGSVAATSQQNPSGDYPTYYGSSPSEADLLQQAILEKMQCRVQWNAREMSSSWCQPEISHGSLIRPSASETASGKIPRSVGMPPLGGHQHQMCATPVERSMPPDHYGELQKIPGPSWTENVRILRPPGSAQTGVWFTLQALYDQNGDRMLPQIPKNYLRIKDGSMTILVVKKYLVKKLELNSESEIEIMCKGEELLEGVTLQHVRDVMWVSEGNENWKSKSVVSISNHCSADHLMVLHYRRSRFSAPSAIAATINQF